MKAFALIICCLIGTWSLKAQQIVYHPFPDIKAKWVVTTMKMEPNMNIITYDDNYSVKGDTMINNTRYFKFKTLEYNWAIASVEYYRQDTIERKIYKYDIINNTDFLVYSYNWQINDTVYFFDTFSNAACSYGIIYELDSVIDQEDNTFRKLFKFYNDENTTPGGILFSEYTDGLGYNFGPNQAFFYTEGLIYRNLTCFTVLSSDTCTLTTITQQQMKKNGVNAFPNPASERLNIQSSSSFNKINIYNHLGQQLKSFDFPSPETNFSYDLENLNNGIYLIHVYSNNKQFQKVIKFIKN